MSTLTLAAAVVLRDEDGRVLLVKENYGRERWGPARRGHRGGETPAGAAIREAAEGVGLIVELEHLTGLYELHGKRPGLRYIFAGRTVGGEPALPETGEIAALGWFSPDALPSRTTHAAPLGVLDAVAGRAGVLRVLDI